MQSPFSGGLLIVFDGIDGVGKTTQSALTAQLFGERGIRCAYSKEPTSGPWGTKLRESAKAGRLSPEDELEYFLKDRQEHVENTIRPTLDAGGVVVLDRYYFSTAAYQGIRGFDFWEIIERNEAFAPRPDLFFLLDLKPAGGLDRIRKRGDTPNAFENEDALTQAREMFLKAQALECCQLVDAARPMTEVAADIRSAVSAAAAAKGVKI